MAYFNNSNKTASRRGQVGDGREPLRASRRCLYLLSVERGRGGRPRPPANLIFWKETKRKFFFKKGKDILLFSGGENALPLWLTL